MSDRHDLEIRIHELERALDNAVEARDKAEREAATLRGAESFMQAATARMGRAEVLGASLAKALEELLAVKAIKEEHGKTQAYLDRRGPAWKDAIDALGVWKEAKKQDAKGPDAAKLTIGDLLGQAVSARQDQAHMVLREHGGAVAAAVIVLIGPRGGRILELLDLLNQAGPEVVPQIRAVVGEIVESLATDGPKNEDRGRRWARLYARARTAAEDAAIERDEARQDLEETAQERDAMIRRLGFVLAELESWEHGEPCTVEAGEGMAECICGIGQIHAKIGDAMDAGGRGLRVAAVALAAEALIAGLDKYAPAWRAEILQQATDSIGLEIACDEVVADWRELVEALGQDPSGIH